MYVLTCPHCGKDDTYWEYEGHLNQWVPYDCEHCDETFWVLHRSFFDLTYDTHDVEIKTEEQLDAMVKAGILKHVPA